jgi:FtsP/CotA-like multicopper oxidase with cupredoxin domain
MPQITRRSVLRRGGALGLVLAAPTLLASCSPAYTPDQGSNPLNIPPLLTALPEDGTDTFDLALGHGETEFFNGVKTRTMGINQSYLGPTLRLTAGNNVRLNVANNLSEDATLHWHGFHLPAASDGGPHQVIRPGTTWSPEFQVRQKAGTFWYHSHLMGKTAEQVWAGLAGMIIVDDAESAGLDLPTTYGLDDIPLVLQDRSFTEDGQMPYAPGFFDMIDGLIGNVPLTNGTVGAFFEAKTRLLRLRLLNGSNATFYAMHFADGRAFFQIASDGGLLERPFETNQVLLAPGERAEVLVDLSNGERTILRAAPMKSEEAVKADDVLIRTLSGEKAPFDFLEIRPSGSGGAAEVPKTLASLPAVRSDDAVRTRLFELDMGLRSHTINGMEMDMARVNEVVPVGETEIWEITNKSWMAHPFHIHDTQFRILDRGGKPPHPGEAGLKDTVVSYPKKTLRILVRFDEYTDPALPYMYHCHVLEHEDAGMMGPFTVV